MFSFKMLDGQEVLVEVEEDKEKPSVGWDANGSPVIEDLTPGKLAEGLRVAVSIPYYPIPMGILGIPPKFIKAEIDAGIKHIMERERLTLEALYSGEWVSDYDALVGALAHVELSHLSPAFTKECVHEPVQMIFSSFCKKCNKTLS